MNQILDGYRIERIYKMGSGYTHYSKTYVSFGTYCSFTYNCQNFSIAGFENIIDNLPIPQILPLCREVGGGRRILLIDVNHSYHDKVKEAFNGYDFIVDQRYESTNGSDMHLYYINIQR